MLDHDLVAISLDLERLSELSLSELGARWRAVTGVSLKGARRDLLLRAIAYRLQAQQQGGLSAKAHQRLAQLAKTYPRTAMLNLGRCLSCGRAVVSYANGKASCMR
jgi:hypothetical protein